MRGMKEEREMVGLERFWGFDGNSSIVTAAEQFESLHRNRKIKFYGKQRPTQDDSFFLPQLPSGRRRKIQLLNLSQIYR